MAELYAEVAEEEQRLARGPSQRQYWDRKTFSSFAEQQRAMARCSTLYIGNLSFFTSEAQIYLRAVQPCGPREACHYGPGPLQEDPVRLLLR
ncbi:hypothetical protein P3T76_007635 [Phytophthora citrophthora]|uniref:RRM domain-containing protein n=1 Tax=Phytophthora citrophthora TaxID=4793 RepID=A0AAD9LN88_9STRA|nr:hypothetical protein P3T76_007635 [Phytophthora citrophthora]